MKSTYAYFINPTKILNLHNIPSQILQTETAGLAVCLYLELWMTPQLLFVRSKYSEKGRIIKSFELLLKGE